MPPPTKPGNSAQSLSLPLLDDPTRSYDSNAATGAASETENIGSVPDGEEKYFGGKVITLTGGIALLLNNATGPGLVQIPLLFQQSGWLPSVAMFLSSFALSVLSALMLVEATSRIPGNSTFDKRVEFAAITRYYCPRWLHRVIMIVFVVAFQASNISAIILSSQTMDTTLVAMFKKSVALEIYPSFGGTSTSDGVQGDSPFGDAYVVSVGFIVILCLTIPMGYFNLDDNIWVQKGAFAMLLMCLLTWTGQFIGLGLNVDNLPALSGGGFNQLGVLVSNTLLNYAFVVTVPSWVNEKKDGVSVNRTVVSAMAGATAMYIAIGIFGGLALDASIQGDDGSELLAVLTQSPRVHVFTKVMTYIFPLAAIITTIPIFSIIIRYNLLEEKICGTFARARLLLQAHAVAGHVVANLFAVILPWGVSLFVYAGNTIQIFMTWTTLVVQIALNFLVSLDVASCGSAAVALTLALHVPVGLFIYCCNQPVDQSAPCYTIVPKRFLRTVRNRRRVMFAAVALLALLLLMNLAALATQIISVASPDDGGNS